jgi:hypothetical protein
MQVNEQAYFGGVDDFMTVRHLTIHGSNFEIGRALGELARDRYGMSPADYAADPVYASARRAYFQRNYPVHWQRVRGAASAFGRDADDHGYDFTGLRYNMDLPLPAPGCSVAYYPPSTTASGAGYLSRNYDFSTGTLADLMQLPPSSARPSSPMNTIHHAVGIQPSRR